MLLWLIGKMMKIEEVMGKNGGTLFFISFQFLFSFFMKNDGDDDDDDTVRPKSVL